MYKCDHCPKSYASKDVCKRHMKNNVCKWQKDKLEKTIPKKYTCSICKHGFNLRSDLKEHQLNRSDWCKRMQYILPTNENDESGNALNVTEQEQGDVDKAIVITIPGQKEIESVEQPIDEYVSTIITEDDGTIYFEVTPKQIDGIQIQSQTTTTFDDGKYINQEPVWHGDHEDAVIIDEEIPIARIPPGFVNPLTNSCYLNSVLQTMFNNEKFTTCLMQYYNRHEGYCYSSCECLTLISFFRST